MSDNEKTTHGGPRPGAGRKPGWRKPDARRRMTCIKLTEAEHEAAIQLGNGNVSAGIRLALAMATKPKTRSGK